ncbi:hypothetical protein N8865_01245 [Francisellaceae bacterium]|nr:hypothetical protein [Francisellaceae bacterium]
MEINLERSKKYANYTDEELIQLFVQDVKGQNAHYLDVELIHRGLLDEAEQAKVSKVKSKPKKSKFLIILPLIFLGMLIARYFKQYF